MPTLVTSAWYGRTSLWKSFWLIGVAGTFILSYFFEWLFLKTITSTPNAYMAIVVPAVIVSICYTVFAYVAIWRSSNLYTGPKVFAVGARLVLLLYFALIIYSIYQVVSLDTDDPGKSSKNISGFLMEDPEYPLIGFWKRNCNNDFGIAIDKTGNSHYSISFCGPGGCFKPGTYRPDSRIYGDSNYEVVSENRIEIKGMDGFSTYYRCTK
jgi:hypothetical protein